MLNELQKQMMQAAIDFIFETIDEVPLEIAIAAYQAVRSDEIYRAHKSRFEELGIDKGIVEGLREIYTHPNPQNRVMGNPYLGQEPGLAVWRNANGIICKEPLGLLNLTAHNDDQYSSVTAKIPNVTTKDVRDYLGDMIDKQLLVMQTRLIKLQNERLEVQSHRLVAQGQTITQLSQLAGVVSAATNDKEREEKHAQERTLTFAFVTEKTREIAELQRKRQHEEALVCITQLLNQDPRNPEYLFLRAKSLAPLGQRAHALADFSSALKQRPKHAQTWIERGVTLEYLGDLSGAIRDYTQVFKLNPPDSKKAFILQRRAGLYMGLKDIETGLANYQQALNLMPQSSEIYKNRGRDLLFLERYEEAERDLNQALHLGVSAADSQEINMMLKELRHHASSPSSRPSSRANCRLM